MRIAFVAPFGLRAKGTTRARALPLARALAARGHSTALFVPPYDSPGDSGKRWEEGGVDVINMVLPRFETGFGAFGYLWLAWRVLRALQRWEPDLVHVFKPKGPSGLVGTAIWLMRPRTDSATQRASVHSYRPSLVVDCDDWEGPGGWNDDPRMGYSVLQRRFFAWQERYGLAHANAWTVTSTCLRDRAVGFGADSARVLILPNGVQTSVGTCATVSGSSRLGEIRLPSAIGRQPSAILYTRFAGVRVQSVTAIWRRVREVIPTARLTVVGRGLASEEEGLRNVPGIDVLGWLEPGELPARLASAHLAVVPWSDTPSNRARHSAKVLELMTAGLPIVAYAVGELPATLGDAGVLVEPGDEVAFSRAIVALFGDDERAGTLGEMARRRVLDGFTWDKVAEIAVKAYRAAGANLDGTRPTQRKVEERGAVRKAPSD
jgi:glycosyltransferase involved in cell wall biosynthesis